VSSCAWEGFFAEELRGVAKREGDGESEHAERADGAAEVEEENAVTEDVRVGVAQKEEVAEDEEQAELGGPEEEL
jgi:hypothetical protein